MTKPSECKWCRCKSVHSTGGSHVKFTCRSTWMADGDCWACSSQCCDWMRGRIQRAVAVLEGARRYDFVDGYLPCMSRRSDGEFIEHETAKQAIEILRGNSPESPDNSPVTADDLAVADYYEAVRQRVPWMTSIEHIEDLIEGYRKCGVMVWQAAEQVKLIFGGRQ